jgi:hypothetical protein
LPLEKFTGSMMIKRLFLILLTSYSVTTYAENKKPQLVVVNVADIQKQYSTSPNTKIEVQSVSNTPLAVQKVVVNRGACLVLPDNKITNLPSYGSRAEYLMGGCYARNITEIAVYLMTTGCDFQLTSHISQSFKCFFMAD